MKKTVKKEILRGKDQDGRYNNTKANSTMFPVTCADGLFPFRFDKDEKARLLAKALKLHCKMAELFGINGTGFKLLTRKEIKNQVLSSKSLITKDNYRSVAQYVREVVIGK